MYNSPAVKDLNVMYPLLVLDAKKLPDLQRIQVYSASAVFSRSFTIIRFFENILISDILLGFYYTKRIPIFCIGIFTCF